LQAREDSCNRNGDACWNDGDAVKKGLDDSANKNGNDVYPNGEKFKDAAIPLTLLVSDKAIDDKKVVDNQEERV
jgi:hypothetical protein